MAEHSELNELAKVDMTDIADGFRAHLDDDIPDDIVVHDDETIGFLMVCAGHHPSRQYSRYRRIVNLSIDEAYRNRGHGTTVIERVRNLARERGCDHLKVSCEWQNEDARRFYRVTGCRPEQIEYAQPLE